MNKLLEIREHGVSAQGRKEYIKHLQENPITLKEGVLAKCYDCMGYYVDGKVDCEMPDCPLYDWMPYRTSPSIKVKKRKTKKLSVSEKKKLVDRLQAGRKS